MRLLPARKAPQRWTSGTGPETQVPGYLFCGAGCLAVNYPNTCQSRPAQFQLQQTVTELRSNHHVTLAAFSAFFFSFFLACAPGSLVGKQTHTESTFGLASDARWPWHLRRCNPATKTQKQVSGSPDPQQAERPTRVPRGSILSPTSHPSSAAFSGMWKLQLVSQLRLDRHSVRFSSREK